MHVYCSIPDDYYVDKISNLKSDEEKNSKTAHHIEPTSLTPL
jgi:hypothetical protein